MKKTATQYVEEYYQNYANGEVDLEIEAVATFLIKNTKSKVLDCGCGPVPQLWSICMPEMKELHAIDLPKESIDFAKDKIEHVSEWCENFDGYKKIVEKNKEVIPQDYIRRQVSKIKSVQQADMTHKLPFPKNYFDTVISLYSLGCLKNEEELKKAISNIKEVLKSGGVFLHINTNGQNKNNILPAYTWNGLDQSSKLIEEYLQKEGFVNISIEKIKLDSDDRGMYKYDEISLLQAVRA
jgi:ubiquinone/menaquinone biosynthesis C-methylase UbiE